MPIQKENMVVEPQKDMRMDYGEALIHLDVGGRDAALNAVSLGWDAETTNAGGFFMELC